MANYYVSTTGNNANAGTTTAGAWATIARAGTAGSVVTVGDVVNVLPGTWVLSGFVTTKANITYFSTVQYGAILDGRGSGIAAAATLWSNHGNGVVIDGFDLSTHGRHGVYNDADDVEIRNCYIHDILAQGSPGGSGGAGIDTTGARTDVHHNKIVRVDAANATPNHMHGIYLAFTSATVTNNIILNVSSCGINNWHGATNSTIINNTILNCKNGILIGQGDAGATIGHKHAFVANNISCFNTQFGIHGTSFAGTGSNIYKNNCVFSNPTNYVLTSTDVNTGGITVDPKHVNYLSNGNGNYQLSSTSLCIGAGISTGSASLGNVVFPTTDFAYGLRPQGAAYDIGAYEFGAAADTTAPILTSATGTTTGQTTADLFVRTDEGNGTVYYWASTNAVEIDVSIIANGTGYVVSGASGLLWHVTGLAANTTYFGHFVHDDSSGNRSNVLHSTSFTTLAGADTTAPVLSLPTASSSDPNIADMTVTTDEANGTLYCWVTQNATETAANIIATTSDTGLVTTTGIQSVTVDLLFPNTNYYGHFVHVDAANNQSNVVHTTVFQTEPAPAGVNRPGIGGNLRRRFHIR